ncbi:hypothetical protein MM35RIKEN_09650 [Vescimonas fastidiosa]|uniref:Uncharacterized protein n=1 Tax=Vescimonas fastidiosa TaxID=2714353 RepID=A0A810Q1Y6_9FIRM|nr:hypothetical protein MM35RIKEN_09650 [Vescimonas fastidiosa]
MRAGANGASGKSAKRRQWRKKRADFPARREGQSPSPTHPLNTSVGVDASVRPPGLVLHLLQIPVIARAHRARGNP